MTNHRINCLKCHYFYVPWDVNEEDRKKIKISWFIRLANYDGKIVILE